MEDKKVYTAEEVSSIICELHRYIGRCEVLQDTVDSLIDKLTYLAENDDNSYDYDGFEGALD